MLIIVKELYCFLLKKQKINERYEQEENDKVFFTKIFGIPFFDGLDITEANEIYIIIIGILSIFLPTSAIR